MQASYLQLQTLVTFTEEFFNEKLHFLCSEKHIAFLLIKGDKAIIFLELKTEKKLSNSSISFKYYHP